MGILLVAFAVFGWGLQYKMSLYDSTSDPSTSIPHAKLLSLKERPASLSNEGTIFLTSAQLQPSMLSLAFLFADFVLCLFGAASPWILAQLTNRTFYPRRSAASSFFSFRPPPVPNPSI
jgi:hypothetical protein